MRKFAMTLMLGLGMATASFAGNVETAEARVQAVKESKTSSLSIVTPPDYVLVLSCGIVIIVPGHMITDEQTWGDTWHIDARLCNNI